MKFFDNIVAFLTTAFDKFMGWLGLLKKGFEFLVNSRIAVTSLIIGTVKGFYDASVGVLNDVLAAFQQAPGVQDPGASANGIGALLAFGNCILPISEALQVMVLLMELWLVCIIVKLKFRFLPRLLR